MNRLIFLTSVIFTAIIFSTMIFSAIIVASNNNRVAIKPISTENLQVFFALYSNINRTEYKYTIRQKQTLAIAKRNLQLAGFENEILQFEPTPNPISLRIRIRQHLAKTNGILKLHYNSIVVDKTQITEIRLMAIIREIDREKSI